jgi:uncharacterized BrkB/YihY/UPF0761 family membrane protein
MLDVTIISYNNIENASNRIRRQKTKKHHIKKKEILCLWIKLAALPIIIAALSFSIAVFRNFNGCIHKY